MAEETVTAVPASSGRIRPGLTPLVDKLSRALGPKPETRTVVAAPANPKPARKRRGKLRPQRPSRQQVVSELDPLAVIKWCGIPGHRSAGEFRTRHCPTCGQRERDAVAVNLQTGAWYCHAHGCSGDVLTLLGGYQLLTEPEDFPDLLDLAAKLVEGSEPRAYRVSRERTTQQWQQERARAASERAERAWESYASDSVMGREYLASRGVLNVVATGLVRFTANGDPAIALYDLDPGNPILNVVIRRRTRQGAGPEKLGLDGCTTLGTFVGRLDVVGPESTVIITEGMFDSLTARLAWPDAVVLGAHGAGRVAQVAEAAAARKPRRMLLVPHDDEAGKRAVDDARARVEALGLSIELVQVGHKDLNDAWRAGWRPTALSASSTTECETVAATAAP